MEWFAWYNLVFLLPIVLGAMLALGAALGGVDAGHDIDVDVDAEAEADHGDGDSAESPLQLLGLGRVPLTILMMLWLFTFGVAGVTLKTLLLWFGLSAAMGAAIAALLAIPVSLFSSAAIARVIARLLPTTETYAAVKGDLIGLSGTAELEVTTEFGVVNVRDEGGALHKLRVRTYGQRVGKGTEVLITDHDPTDDFFIVEESPLSNRGEHTWY